MDNDSPAHIAADVDAGGSFFICPYTAACRAKLIASGIPALLGRLPDRCRETDAAKAERCAAMLGLRKSEEAPNA